MTTFAREMLCEVVQEVQPLLLAHHEELTPRKDLRRLNPQWKAYALLEQLERYAIFTARDERGALVGYGGFHVVRHLHDADFAMAQNDLFYIVPERRRGTTAMSFLHYCEEQLVALPVRMICYLGCAGNNLLPILHRLGYADEPVMASKYF